MKPIALFFLSFLFLLSLPAQTKIIAHRGFSSIAPENTLSAFQEAIDVGAEYFELDVHASKDGVPIVVHDYTIDKTASYKQVGEVKEMTSSELAEIRVGYPSKFGKDFMDEPLPTLYDALALAKGKIKVCVEIKVEGAEQEILTIIRELGMEEELIIFSFYTSVLEAFHQLAPEIPTLFLIAKKNNETMDLAQSLHAKAIGVGPVSKINKSYLEKAHNAGLEVWKWTVNKEGTMKKLLGLPIDGLITNFPDKALEIRNKSFSKEAK